MCVIDFISKVFSLTFRLAKALERNIKSIRLVQETYNTVSFALYAKLGFDPKDQMTVLTGVPSRPLDEAPSWTYRDLTKEDLPQCKELIVEVMGVKRSLELERAALSDWWPKHFGAAQVAVAKDNGKILGYMSATSILGHGVGRSEEIVAGLYAFMAKRQAGESAPHMLKVFGRLNPRLLVWALNSGLRVQRQCTLMVRGDYSEVNVSKGTYIPSIAF